MPSVVLEVPEQYDSISRSVQHSVIEHVRRITGMTEKTKFQHNPEETDTAQPGSTMGSMDKFGGEIEFPYTDKATVSVREEFIAEATLTNVVRRPLHRTIFKDPSIYVNIYPSYQWVTMSMDFELRFKDRATAMNWYSGFQRALSQRRSQQTHTVVYHYPVPEAFLVILQQIYTLREQQGGYGQTLTEYVNEFGNKNLTSIVNQAGRNELVVMKETQHEIVGHFDFEAAVPKPEANARDGVHYSRFSYTVEYDKPVSVVMNYPNVIHNQLMPSTMFDIHRGYDLDKLLAASGSLDFEAQRKLLRETGLYFSSGQGYHGLPIPEWDDWIPEYLPEGEIAIFRGLTIVEPDDPTLLMGLKEMGNYNLDPLLIDFLSEDPSMLLKPLESPVKLYMFKGYQPYDPSLLEVSDELIVRSKTPLDIRGYYHVVTTLFYDLRLLSRTAQDRLCRHGQFTINLMKVLAPDIEALGKLPTLRPNGTITRHDFLVAVAYIHSRLYPRIAPYSYGMRVVGVFTTFAKDRETLPEEV